MLRCPSSRRKTPRTTGSRAERVGGIGWAILDPPCVAASEPRLGHAQVEVRGSSARRPLVDSQTGRRQALGRFQAVARGMHVRDVSLRVGLSNRAGRGAQKLSDGSAGSSRLGAAVGVLATTRGGTQAGRAQRLRTAMQAMPAEEEEEEEVSTRAFQVQLRACVAELEGRTPVGAHARGGQWCPNVGVELFDSPTSGGLEELPGVCSKTRSIATGRTRTRSPSPCWRSIDARSSSSWCPISAVPVVDGGPQPLQGPGADVGGVDRVAVAARRERHS